MNEHVHSLEIVPLVQGRHLPAKRIDDLDAGKPKEVGVGRVDPPDALLAPRDSRGQVEKEVSGRVGTRREESIEQTPALYAD
jgi:hypothetical protein